MNDGKSPRQGSPAAPRRKNAGVTLIELGFVVGIIAVIVVGVLTIYTSVTRQQAVTKVTTDVAAIKTALTAWTSGRWLQIPDGYMVPQDSVGVEREWKNWSQLSAYLPGDLGRQASASTGQVLTKVNNNWSDVQYEFEVNDPYLWTLTVSPIPSEADAQTLGRRLEEGSEMITVTADSVAVQYPL